MKYKIGNDVQEVTAKSGTKYKKCRIKDEKGIVTESVAVFSSFSQYNNLVTGAEVEAILKEKDYNGSKSYSLEDAYKPNGGGGGFAKAAEAKSENIKKAMDRKEEAISISSTARDATLIVTKFYPLETTEEEIKKNWLRWRKWLLNNWEPNNENLTSHGDPVPDFVAPIEEINPDDIPF